MGSCSSNHEDNNGGQGFNPGDNGGDGFNPGGESHRPHSRQAGNMVPHPEQPQHEEAAAQNEAGMAMALQGDNKPEEPNAQPMGNIASPVMGGMRPPAPRMGGMPPQAAAPQQPPAAPQGAGAGRPWIDFDPRTNKPMLMANGQLGRAGGSQEAHDPQPMDQELPPQAGQAYGSPLIIGAVSADVSGGQIVHEGHWEEFEAANNVMLLEDFNATIGPFSS